MADLKRGRVRGTTVRGDDGALYGTPLWIGDYSPVEGDDVMLLVDAGTALVLGPASGSSKADTGTISGTTASGRVPVTVGSTTYSARYIGTPPGSGTLVYLAWAGSIPWVIGTAAASATGGTPGTQDPTPPPVAGSGTLFVPAIDSGSWRSIDGWGTASSRPQSITTKSVVQYQYTSSPYSGAWFHGLAAAQLAGATITAIRLRLPSRLVIGSYNAALSAHIYLHTSSSRPAGDVTRTAGPSDQVVTAASSWVPTFITLPLAWAPTLLAGGGIGIYGSPYLGFAGIDSDPASGQLAIDWTR